MSLEQLRRQRREWLVAFVIVGALLAVTLVAIALTWNL